MKVSVLTLSSLTSSLLLWVSYQPLLLANKPSSKTPVVTPTTKLVSFEQYKKDCRAMVTQQKLGEFAEDICQCTMTRFRKQYSIQEFNALVAKSKTDKAAKRQLSKVGEACFEEEVLYKDDNTKAQKNN